jgi:transposase
MTDNLTIVRAVYSGLSQRQAAATYHVSRNTVSLLLRHAKAQGWLNPGASSGRKAPPSQGYRLPPAFCRIPANGTI